MGLDRPKRPTRREVLKGLAATTAMAVTMKGDMEKMPTPNPEKLDTFDRQFIRRMQIGGVETNVMDATPEHLSSEAPVLIAPAWAIPMRAYKPGAKVLMEEGSRVLSLDHPRRGDVIRLNADQRETLKNFPSEAVRKASQFIELLDKKGVDAEHPADVVAHSEGCLNTIAAALAAPEKFRGIVLYGAPGFGGPDSTLRLLSGWIGQIVNPMPVIGSQDLKSLDAISVSDESKRIAKERGQIAIEYPPIEVTPETKAALADGGGGDIKYIADNPIRSVKEAYGLAQIELLDLIQPLRERGIKVAIISGVDDLVFPNADMQKNIGKGKLDGFLSVRGKHGQLAETPEHHMRAAAILLKQFEKNAKAKQ